MAKIFIRERNNINPGDQQPRFAVVGVQGTDMTFYQLHMRKGELDAIARALGADLVVLPRGSGDHIGQEGGGGKRKPRRKTAKRGAAR